MLILGRENKITELMPTAKASFQVLEGTKVRVNTETTAPLLEVFEKFETYSEAWNPEREVEYTLYLIENIYFVNTCLNCSYNTELHKSDFYGQSQSKINGQARLPMIHYIMKMRRSY